MLLRPGWIAAALLVVAFTAACIWVLAPWQLGKSEQVELRSGLIERAEREQAVPLEDVQQPGDTVAPSDEWRRVTVRGSFLPQHEVLVPNRMGASGTATHVLTPFQVAESGTVILVNRGATAQDDATGQGDATATEALPAPPVGITTITAQLRPTEETSRYAPPRVEGGTVVASAIDPTRLSEVTGLALAPFHLQLFPGQAGALGELPMPSADSASPHFSYGVQWLLLGAGAPIALGVLARSHVRREQQVHTE